MRVILHPLAETNQALKETYVVIDEPYNGSMYELKNLRFGDDQDIHFDLDLIELYYDNKAVTDIILINHHFKVIQDEVGQLVINAITAFVESHKESSTNDSTTP